MFFGLSGLFGKWIDLPALLVTWGRCTFAFVALFFLILFQKRVETGHALSLRLQRTNHYFIFTGLGIFLALHWWAFFYSIQISTVAVGLLTFSTFPVFSVFLEPLFFKERIRYTDIVAALVAFGGIAWMTPKFDLNDSITIGAVFGVVFCRAANTQSQICANVFGKIDYMLSNRSCRLCFIAHGIIHGKQFYDVSYRYVDDFRCDLYGGSPFALHQRTSFCEGAFGKYHFRIGTCLRDYFRDDIPLRNAFMQRNMQRNSHIMCGGICFDKKVAGVVAAASRRRGFHKGSDRR